MLRELHNLEFVGFASVRFVERQVGKLVRHHIRGTMDGATGRGGRRAVDEGTVVGEGRRGDALLRRLVNTADLEGELPRIQVACRARRVVGVVVQLFDHIESRVAQQCRVGVGERRGRGVRTVHVGRCRRIVVGDADHTQCTGVVAGLVRVGDHVGDGRHMPVVGDAARVSNVFGDGEHVGAGFGESELAELE